MVSKSLYGLMVLHVSLLLFGALFFVIAGWLPFVDRFGNAFWLIVNVAAASGAHELELSSDLPDLGEIGGAVGGSI